MKLEAKGQPCVFLDEREERKSVRACSTRTNTTSRALQCDPGNCAGLDNSAFLALLNAEASLVAEDLPPTTQPSPFTFHLPPARAQATLEPPPPPTPCPGLHDRLVLIVPTPPPSPHAHRQRPRQPLSEKKQGLFCA